MDEIVIKSQKGNPVTTSKLVAEKFGKRHVEVLDAIRELLLKAQNSTFVENQQINKMFYLSQESVLMPIGGGYKKTPIYVMNRDGFSLLIMGFTGSEAFKFKLEFIEAFNKMEAIIKQSLPQTFAEALQLAANQAKQIENQQKQLTEQEPKVLFADSVSTSDKSILISELAKILKQNGISIGQNRLFEKLRNENYLLTKGDYYNKPSQKAMELGLFEIKETVINKPDGKILLQTTTKVTGKGQVYFVNKFVNKSIECH